jgi:hypothetical protein
MGPVMSLRPASVLVILAVAAAGCSSAIVSESDALESDDEEITELRKVLGDDRVARAFLGQPARISSKLGETEQLLGVGRACARPGSKEIFIVEEKSTRFGGKQQDTRDLLPRAVIGGCNVNPTAVGSIRQSFELFVAAISDKSFPLDDPFSVEPVELMALDATTGLYNFYIIERPEPAHPHDRPTVTRFARRPDGKIERLQKVARRPATREVSSNRKCFDCHVHGGPVMNELTQPWTGWVSSNATYSRPTLTGTSRELVSEARPFASEHTRSSLANDLEKITRAAIAMWVEGLPERPGSGLGPRTLSGEEPGGVTGLLKSVFCETELNFASSFETVPFPLFVDDQVARMAGLPAALPPTSSSFPQLLPVRSETDRRIEVFLQRKGILKPDTALAVRVFDDEHDVFSPTRCSLHAPVAAAIASGQTPDKATREAIAAALSRGGPRERFVRALIADAPEEREKGDAEAAYIEDLHARYGRDVAKLESAAGLAELDDRLARRQRAAQAMFPSPANMLPRLQHVPPIFVPREAPR